MSKIQTLVSKMAKTRAKLKQMEEQYQALRLEALQSVLITSRGETVSLLYGFRVVKCKKMGVNRRWRVWEGDRILIREYTGGNLHDIRYMIATGEI